MFDFLRNRSKSAEERRRERLNAYIDGELSGRELQQFEQELATEPALQAEVEAVRAMKANLRELPRVRAPRNFTLDPARYGVPEPDRVGQWYPVLRVATALTAVVFVLLVVVDLVQPGLSDVALQSAEPAALETADETAGDFDLQRAPELALPQEEIAEEPAEEEAILESGVAEAPAAEPEVGEEAIEEEPAPEGEGAIMADPSGTLTPPRTAESEAAYPFATPPAGIAAAEASPTPLPTVTLAQPTLEPQPTEVIPPAEPVVAPPAELSQAPAALLIAEVLFGILLAVLIAALLLLRRRL